MNAPNTSHASRRDRRGRGVRGPLAWPPVPVMVSRAEEFDDLVMDAAERLEPHWSLIHPRLEFAVDDIPNPGAGTDDIPLGRVFAAERDRPARVVIYRRPVESRAVGRREVAALVTDVVTEQVAALLGRAPEDIDPGYDG